VTRDFDEADDALRAMMGETSTGLAYASDDDKPDEDWSVVGNESPATPPVAPAPLDSIVNKKPSSQPEYTPAPAKSTKPSQAPAKAGGGRSVYYQGRKMRVVTAQDHAKREAGINLRKFAIPLLLVMGLLLCGAGGYTWWHSSQMTDEQMAQASALMKNWGLFMGVSFALGGTLLIGAIIFQIEIHLHAKKASRIVHANKRRS
jgi:hypothetical protein